MQFHQLFILLSLAIVSSFGGCRLINAAAPPISKKITVTPSGRGDFTTIQAAIDRGVPENNNQWIQIYLIRGIYRENVIIPINKPYILLQGESSRTTVIEYSSKQNIWNATLSVKADNFVGKHITFKNTYNRRLLPNGHPREPAVSAFITGDKVAFYECGFISLQDTLYDAAGRHFFYKCYIEGSVDFIMGNGQSIYQQCKIVVTGGVSDGFITAQQRISGTEPTGFVFKFCTVVGRGPTNLGRAWGPYSRVLFFKTKFALTVTPWGWDAWYYKGKENNIVYAEVACTGRGSDTSKRVPWEKKLTHEQVQMLVGPKFNNADGWIESQPQRIA